MPLRTDDLRQARVAYRALEGRMQSAERRAEQLAARLSTIGPQLAASDETAPLRQRIVDLEAENFRLRTALDKLAQLKADLPLQTLVAGLGLAAAIGEASMPNRAVASIGATVQTYLLPGEEGLGLRFQQPELGAFAVGLSATAFELAKVPPAPGVPAPRSLYAVLQDKQRVLAEADIARLAPAAQLQAKIAELFANSGAWHFGYLVQAAADMATQERALAALIAQQATGGVPGAYRAAVEALAALTAALTGKANPVAGDLLALCSALDASTAALRAFVS